ncbi:MAG: hypothetical protein Q7T33_01025 [Dehalococcoidia bacterium]|nr:hypothetical protein [Dehalococcoidia bacterium]
MRRLLLFSPLLLLLLTALACGGGGDGGDSSASPGDGATSTPGGQAQQSPQATAIVPPLEGPPRGVAAGDRVDYRELPEWQLPNPGDLPAPPPEAQGQEFHAPEAPACPPDWLVLQRPSEGFTICYPPDWRTEGHGYVAAGNEEQWYSLGLILFQGERQLAHVSVYMVPRFAQPFTYTRDCQQAFAVAFAGQPAVLCPDYPGNPPEAKIIAYHIRRDDRDYFVNVVPYFQYDEAAKTYSDGISDNALATAIQVAQTFGFIPIAGQ